MIEVMPLWEVIILSSLLILISGLLGLLTVHIGYLLFKTYGDDPQRKQSIDSKSANGNNQNDYGNNGAQLEPRFDSHPNNRSDSAYKDPCDYSLLELFLSPFTHDFSHCVYIGAKAIIARMKHREQPK